MKSRISFFVISKFLFPVAPFQATFKLLIMYVYMKSHKSIHFVKERVNQLFKLFLSFPKYNTVSSIIIKFFNGFSSIFDIHIIRKKIPNPNWNIHFRIIFLKISKSKNQFFFIRKSISPCRFRILRY